MLIYEGKLQDGNLLHVEAVSKRIFRVRIYDRWQKESAMNRYGIVQELPEPQVEKSESEAAITVKTDCATLTVSKTDGSLLLKNAQGKAVLENVCPPVNEHEGWKETFLLENGAKIYGLGDITRDRIEKTGYQTEVWIENVKSYVPIPFLMSTAGWGIYLNTTWRHWVDVGSAKADELALSARDGGIDLYLFVGDDCRAILNEYTNLLGKPAMLPVWAYGLTYVCNQEVNAFDMMQECLNFRREGIPCDVCGLEPGWMEKNYDYSTEKKWDPGRFYLPFWAPKGDATFLGAMSRLGYKLSLWLCCDYDLSFEEERQANATIRKAEAQGENADNFEQDIHFGARGKLAMDHITKVDEPWFEHLKKFVDQGACCFKLDGANQVIDHPDRKWGNGMDDEEMHNLYALIYNKQMSRGFSDYTGRRAMIYSAGGYAGIQRFSATWAGDTGGGPKPLVSMLNHGLSGHVNTSCDMDVFTVGGIHFGFFQPWSQLCNWAYWRQPWFLTNERKAIYRFYANLRYRMLPYIYTTAYRAHETGYPLMRAMSLAYPALANADQLIYQYMFGDDLLTGAFVKEIYLPEGKWTDAWTGKTIEGGCTISASYPETVDGPLYIREGAIIPTCEEVEFIGQKERRHIELNLYPSANKRVYEMYEDDGVSLKYLDGVCAITRMEMQEEDGVVTIRIQPRKGSYEGMPAQREYDVNLMTRMNAAEVTVNGEKAGFSIRRDGWCAQVLQGFVSIPVTENGEEIVITVK